LKNILKELREKRKLTQETLATKLNVSRQTINSIETNKYVASLDLALKIAKFFDLKVEDIFKI
jgi:putative transcriptional regulator